MKQAKLNDDYTHDDNDYTDTTLPMYKIVIPYPRLEDQEYECLIC